jgi:hypothetical protein
MPARATTTWARPADHPGCAARAGRPRADVRAARGPRAPDPEERGGRARDLRLEGAGVGDWRAALRGADAPTPRRHSQAPRLSTVPSDSLGGLVDRRPVPGLDGVLVGVVHEGGPAPLLRRLTASERSRRSDAGRRDESAAARAARSTRPATHGVPGEGNPEADFVVVGEAPGADEDASGRPFVGASGQLLTKILSAINLAGRTSSSATW